MHIPLLQIYSGRNGGINWTQLLLIGILVLVIVYALKGPSPIKKVLAHSHRRFDSIPFSVEEFYQGITAAILAKELNSLAVSRIPYAQGGFLSPQRLYLRIQYKEFMYDICAAPFGKEYFVSWWLGEEDNATYDFLIGLPVIGKLFVKRPKTFFELDTEIMFKEAVTACVKDAVDKLIQEKGLRKLSDPDWNEYHRTYN